MTYEKLANGQWRCRAQVTVDGLSFRRQFSGPRKADVQRDVDEWIRRMSLTPSDRSVADAVLSYIKAKRPVLSPSTSRQYDSIYRIHLQQMDISVADFDQRKAQLFVSDLSDRLSPKTVRNIWSLVAASIDFAVPGKHYSVRLPQRVKPQIYCPDDTLMRKVFEAVRGTDLQVPVALAASIPARRSEICALLGEDVKDGIVTIRHALVLDADRKWITKAPKTGAGYRSVQIPDDLAAILPRSGPVTRLSPDMITDRFAAMLKANDLPSFRFHSLRHYGASVMLSIGIPMKEVQRRGGWESADVLQEIYAHALADQIPKANKLVDSHFKNLWK